MVVVVVVVATTVVAADTIAPVGDMGAMAGDKREKGIKVTKQTVSNLLLYSLIFSNLHPTEFSGEYRS